MDAIRLLVSLVIPHNQILHRFIISLRIRSRDAATCHLTPIIQVKMSILLPHLLLQRINSLLMLLALLVSLPLLLTLEDLITRHTFKDLLLFVTLIAT